MCDTKEIYINGTSMEDYRLKPSMLNIKNMISPKPKKITFVVSGVIDGLFSDKNRYMLDRIKKGLSPIFDSVFLPKHIKENIIAFVEFDIPKKFIYIDCMNKEDFVNMETDDALNIMIEHNMFDKIHNQKEKYLKENKEKEYEELKKQYCSQMIYELCF